MYTWNHLQKTVLRKKSKVQKVWAQCCHMFKNILYVFIHRLVGINADHVSERINHIVMVATSWETLGEEEEGRAIFYSVSCLV